MTFTVIIPSYNEGEDIRLSIESALAQTIKPLEIFVVDDSSDGTPDIIREYAPQGVRLMLGEHKGCCGARNLGMRQAAGDVIVLLNGDVKLPPDFLDKISKHYENGADYVLVESEVLNQKDLFAAFVEAQHQWEYAGDKNIEWTEGFSARRAAIESADYIPGDFRVRFCRDWMLGRRLRDMGFKKIIDRSIVVTHRAPSSFEEYWRVRLARGRFGAFTQYYIYNRSRAYLVAKFAVKHVLRLVALVTVVYPIVHSIALARRSNRFVRNILPFLFAYAIQEIARAAGEWQGVLEIR